MRPGRTLIVFTMNWYPSLHSTLVLVRVDKVIEKLNFRTFSGHFPGLFKAISTNLKFDFQYHSFMYLFWCLLLKKELYYSVPVKHGKPPRYFQGLINKIQGLFQDVATLTRIMSLSHLYNSARLPAHYKFLRCRLLLNFEIIVKC